jgi:alkylation response protein AidB-like acyl-CoA dehydrogenase
MDFRLPDDVERFRDDVRAFLDEHMTAELEERVYRTGVSYDPEFTVALRERGWLTPGLGEGETAAVRNPYEMRVLNHEFGLRDAPHYATGTTSMVASLVKRFGSEELQREILPKVRRGDIMIVLGFSEPESGSDVANAQTRAVRDGDEWVINGSKMFTTNAHIADYVFLLTRTNPDVGKHKGLTTFLVPMKQPGVEVQGVYTLSGERTNITFYNDVRVRDGWRIGDVDGGWRVMTASLQDEHSAGFGCRIQRLLEETEAWARETVDADGRPRIEDPDVRERLARCATELEVALLLEHRTMWMAANGEVPEAEGPMSKLFSSEALERAAQDLCELVGPDALRSYFDPSAPRGGRIEHSLRFSLGTTIYGGTSEIQRNIIASRGLGLPR